MHDFWNQIILDNPVRKYIGVAIAVLLGILLKRILSRFMAGLLFRIVKKITGTVDKTAFIGLVIAPLETFLVIFIAIVSIEKLHFPSAFEFDIYEISSKTIIHTIATAIMIIAFFWLLLRIIDFVALIFQWKANATNDIKDNQLIVFLRDFLKAVVGLVAILVVLSEAFNFEVKNVWAGLGIAGAALALATKESIENLIASFIIFFDKPFTAGDILKVNNISGTVEKIGLRSTRIRTEQKTYVTVPNKQMVDSVVDNYSLRTQRKAELRLQIGLSTTSQKLAEFISGIKKILHRNGIENPSVFLQEITANAYLVSADYFTPPFSINDFNELREQVNLEVLRLMESLQLEIAGASTDVRVIKESE